MITKKQGLLIAKKINSIYVSRKCYLEAAEDLRLALIANDREAINKAKARCKLWIDAEVEAMDILVNMGIPIVSYAETKEIQRSYS